MGPRDLIRKLTRYPVCLRKHWIFFWTCHCIHTIHEFWRPASVVHLQVKGETHSIQSCKYIWCNQQKPVERYCHKQSAKSIFLASDANLQLVWYCTLCNKIESHDEFYTCRWYMNEIEKNVWYITAHVSNIDLFQSLHHTNMFYQPRGPSVVLNYWNYNL